MDIFVLNSEASRRVDSSHLVGVPKSLHGESLSPAWYRWVWRLLVIYTTYYWKNHNSKTLASRLSPLNCKHSIIGLAPAARQPWPFSTFPANSHDTVSNYAGHERTPIAINVPCKMLTVTSQQVILVKAEKFFWQLERKLFLLSSGKDSRQSILPQLHVNKWNHRSWAVWHIHWGRR